MTVLEKNRRGRTALQMKRPGGKERAGGPKNRRQNRQKVGGRDVNEEDPERDRATQV